MWFYTTSRFHVDVANSQWSNWNRWNWTHFRLYIRFTPSAFCTLSLILKSCPFVFPTGNYMLMEGTGVEPGLRAQLISPPLGLLDLAKCLTFKFNLYGFNTGSLGILDENFEPYFTFRNRKCKSIQCKNFNNPVSSKTTGSR